MTANHRPLTTDQQVPLITTYLEMRSREQLRPKRCADVRFQVREQKEPNWVFNRDLYFAVGEQWQWIDKRPWTDEQWKEYTAASELRTFADAVAAVRSASPERDPDRSRECVLRNDREYRAPGGPRQSQGSRHSRGNCGSRLSGLPGADRDVLQHVSWFLRHQSCDRLPDNMTGQKCPTGRL